MNSRNAVVNLQPGTSIPVIRVSQYDVGVTLSFVVYDGNEPASFASGTTVTIQATRPSGTGFVQSCSISGNVVTVNTVIAMTQEYGRMQAELRFVNGSTDVGTGNFVYIVEKAAHPDDTIDADVNQWTELAQQVHADTVQSTQNATTANEAKTSAQNAADTASRNADIAVKAATSAGKASDTAVNAKEAAEAAANTVETTVANTVRFDISQSKTDAQKLQARNNTGAAGVTSLAPAYSASSTYAVGDMITQNGKLYKCSTAIETAEAWTAGHWAEVAVSNEIINLKDYLSQTDKALHHIGPQFWDFGFVDGSNGETVYNGNPDHINRYTPDIFILHALTYITNNYSGTRNRLCIYYYNEDGSYAGNNTIVNGGETTQIVNDSRCRFSLEINESDATIDFNPNLYVLTATYHGLANIYDANRIYTAGDYVLHNGKIYKCLSSMNTPEEWNRSRWTEVRLSAELSETNLSLEKIGSHLYWRYGYIDGQTGICNDIGNQSSQNRFTPGMFFLSNGVIIRNNYNGSERNRLLIYFYNANGAYSGERIAVAGKNDYIIQKDSYCRFSFEITSTDANSGSFNPNTYIKIVPNKKDTGITSVRDELLGRSDGDDWPITWNYGYVNGSTGNIVKSTYDNPNRYSEALFINKGTIITSSYNNNLRIYKPNGLTLKAIAIVTNGSRYVATEDAVVRLSFQILSADVSVDFDPSAYVTITNNYHKYALDALEKINDIETALSGGSVSIPLVWNNGYIDENGNVVIALNANRLAVMQYIPANGNIVTHDTQGRLYVYRYQEDGSFVGRETVLASNQTYIVPTEGWFGFTYESGISTPSWYPDETLIEVYYTKTVGTNNYWQGKKIVWFGTSIPAGVINAGDEMGNGSYPIRIGQKLGATVYNEALGSSCVRIGMHNSISEQDSNGYAGMPATCTLFSFGMTRAEKQEILNNWDYWKTVFTKAVSDIDPSQPDKYLNTSYETKLDKYLEGGSVGPVDFYILDHGYNDGGNSNGHNYTDLTDIPANSKDRTYYIGAMNFIIDRILTSNKQAQIIIVAHYNDESPFDKLVEAQRYVANKWNLPFVETYRNMGFTTSATITVDGVTKTMKDWWLPDGIHPASDATGMAMKHYADVLYPMIRDLR